MTEEYRKLVDSGYTTAQLTDDALAIIDRHGGSMTERGSYELDDLLFWAVGNAWRTAFWNRFPEDRYDISDNTPLEEMLAPEQLDVLREAAAKFFIDDEYGQFESEAERIVNQLLD